MDLSCTKLSRFDIHYFRKGKISDQKASIDTFLTSCKDKIVKSSRIKYVSLDRNSNGFILGIGSRKSPNFYRVYEKKGGLEFEMELKKGALVGVEELLFSNWLEELEEKLAIQFYKRSFGLLDLNTCYTDWLVVRLRKSLKPRNPLVTSYMEKNLICDREYLIRLIQFLSFLRSFKGLKEYLGNKIYYLIEFPVAEFMTFQNVGGKYQRL